MTGPVEPSLEQSPAPVRESNPAPARESNPAPPREPCPGLDPSAEWDEPAALRGEILVLDQLVAHAAELARAHGKPARVAGSSRLRRRFTLVRHQVRDAYVVLTERLKAGRDPSPAEEWLVENSHVIEDQIREIEEDLPRGYLLELPRLATGALRGCPRVYALCLDYLRHTDGRLDLGTLCDYVDAYQTVEVLTIGELWAVPIMLRLGLLMTVGALATSQAMSGTRERADMWAERLLSARQDPRSLGSVLVTLERGEGKLEAPFLVQLSRRLREHDDALLSVAFDWLAVQSEALGATPQELARIQHLKQAAERVSVGNAITSMRAVAALAWNAFFERTSAVEALLRKDPLGVYAATDPGTRDRYRHAVENIGKRVKTGELGVARATLALAEAAHASSPGNPRLSHVGYYLVDEGRSLLEARVRYRPPLAEGVRRLVLAHPGFFYFGAILGLTVAVIAGVVLGAQIVVGSSTPNPWWVVGWVLLAALPASEVAVALVQVVVTAVLRPKLLPRLDLDDGVPEELRTLVVVPCLLDSRATITTLLEELEVRSLANGDENLHFALLTDFTDADTAEREQDDELLEATLSGIQALNARHSNETPRFWLLHRRRTWSAGEGRFIGWERKRGKLEELNRLLRGAEDTTFSRVEAPRALFSQVRFVLTLDADTDLPRDTARDLIAVLGHPLNRPELDAARGRVVRGYGIIQPRVGSSPVSARQSRYAVLASGPAGIDPYTTAVSDVYQDLFAEGSYTGKGIYDVDAFAAALRGRVPEYALLSHDLFESFFARSALVTDTELLDEQPASYEVHAERQHRWIRGDWQLIRWLFPRVPGQDGTRRTNDLRLLDRFKLADNLRRSLLPANLVLVLDLALVLRGRASLTLSVLFAAVLLTPLLARTVLAVTREASRVSGSRFSGFTSAIGLGALRIGVDIVFLLDQALLSLDAIGIALYRLVSRRHLLEWVTARQSSRGKRGRSKSRLLRGSVLALTAGVALLITVPYAALAALPFVVAWALAPFVATWLGRPLSGRANDAPLPATDARFLRLIARKTWRYFAHFVTERDHFLPPDNYQQEPQGRTAHRTSPTNIGLYLLSTLAAHDLGILTRQELVQRLDRTLGTLEGLPLREGHLLNWYDTETLKPLAPEYVSTVDSGNLVGYLWTIASAPLDLRHAPLTGPAPLLAIADALELSYAALASQPKGELAPELLELMSTLRATAAAPERTAAHLLELLETTHTTLVSACATALEEPLEVRYWLGEAERTARSWLEELGRLLPFVSVLRDLPPALEAELGETYRSVRELLLGATSLDALLTACDAARQLLESAPTREPVHGSGHLLVLLEGAVHATREACSASLAELERIAVRCRTLADGMSFRFLFNPERELFATGYNLSTARLDGSHYDLLASEARLASLVAIAKGDVPEKHWFRLARPRTRVDSSQSLLSWSGSMFEYLMPLLVTESLPGTLLDETMQAAVGRQRSYAAGRGIPWGISESAYNVMDLEMTYQYRAFGVPGLGLRAGLGEDLVVTPYATALAALVDSAAAIKNLRALERAGLSGDFGFFEAIDYSPQRLPPGKRAVVVRSFMAHHLGMTLVSLVNVLHDRTMQRRFHADPRIKASALLLEERIPTGAPLVEVPPATVAVPLPHMDDLDAMERVRFEDDMLPRVHLLGHGPLSSLVTATGSGVLTWKGIDINRFREDSVFDSGGIYAYVRQVGQPELWSAGYHPTCRHGERYEAAFAIDRVELHRHDGSIETITELAPSPEHPAEVRRFTLRNHGAETVDIELTTFTELALAPRNADHAHRAFVGMFVETEFVAELGAVVAHRRTREPGEPAIWVAQVLTPEDGDFSALDYETSRGEFIGREGSLERPRALMGEAHAALGKSTGAVLDAALVLRRSVQLKAGSTARVTLATLMAETREELLHLVTIYAAPQAIPRAFELAWADARVELRHLGVTAAQAHSFQRLLSAIVHPLVGLRAPVEVGALASGGISALWSSGISGDVPIVVLSMDHADFDELLRELLLAHAYFRVNAVTLDLVILNEEPAGYLQPLQDHALDLIRATHSEPFLNQRGGIFLRHAHQLPAGERNLILAAARAVFLASRGSLSRQLKRASKRTALPAPLVLSQKPRRRPAPPPPATPPLLFPNGLGGFTSDGREYVMTLEPGQRTPAPWCNVMANSSFGCVVSESGSCFAFAGNSQRHRLTPWSNDALLDPSGAVVYLRDDQDGSVWSATPGPTRSSATHRVVHGQGYTRFAHTEHGIKSELLVFVPKGQAAVVQRLRIENRDSTPRTLSVYGVVEWVLGTDRDASRLTVVTERDAATGALLAMNPLVFGSLATSFYATTGNVESFTTNREEFFGRPGSRRRPHALRRPHLAGQAGAGLDPCGALHVRVTLAPGAVFETSFVLGHAPTRADACALSRALGDDAAVERAFREAVAHWDGLLGAITIQTPDPSVDVLMNRWLLYQALSCRIWARSGFYQSSGAFGFRDQVQDVLCLLHSMPSVAREHLLVAASRQFTEGDAQHWWHTERGDGVRTHCSDDKLWLPYAVAEYTRVTGDGAILEEQVSFLSERLLAPGEHDLYSTPARGQELASLYEHCARAIDGSLEVGARGLPKMGGGDWNDGMNRIGEGGEGESVWLGWFLVKVLHDFAPIARARGEFARAATWLGHAEKLGEALETSGWDGRWYRRAYFDDGTVVGTEAADECRIDALAQSWAVISGTARRHRAREAVLESERLLVREDAQIMCLLTPPFSGSAPDPGYIASYPAGIRENGGQYTHGVLFTLRALAELGETERVARLLGFLNPIHHGDSAEKVALYRVEPYVVAADVYSASGHVGRGGWTWYTGSAAWFYRVVLEDVLGFKRTGDVVTLSPCMPATWPGFELKYSYGRSVLHLIVENAIDARPGRAGRGTNGAGEPRITLVDDGQTHVVRIRAGAPDTGRGALRSVRDSGSGEVPPKDRVDEASWESFPASDPPALSREGS